ncbi:TetR family transcriptional regulator C-terminal domain-containing protein [Microbacterium lacus]|uniref:TetR/AcrR family transcriptional regulator n=1 Tax=Microbacterium lacus TaxID=415217 RepID=UPI00384DCD7A
MSTTPAPQAAQTRAARRAPAQRRAQIADAARDLARDEGLSAVTMRAVATRAGVTPALVAHYAPSMDALVADTFATIVGDELDELDAMTTDGPAVERLATLLGTLLDGSRDDVTLVWVEAFAMGRRSEQLAEAVRDHMDRWQKALHYLIDDGISEGDFRIDDAADAAWQLLGMIDGLNAQALVRWGGASDRSLLLRRAVEGMFGLSRGALDVPPTTPRKVATP